MLFLGFALFLSTALSTTPYTSSVTYTTHYKKQCPRNNWVEEGKYTFGGALQHCAEDPECVAFNFVAKLDPADVSTHGIVATAYFHHDCDPAGYSFWSWNLYVKNPHPTKSPSFNPSKNPTASPTTPEPTMGPTRAPTTSNPTFAPSDAPTTSHPTFAPSDAPTTSDPTFAPSDAPTTSHPTFPPSDAPTTSNPTEAPTTSHPTLEPTPTPEVTYTTHDRKQCPSNNWVESGRYTFGDALKYCTEDPKCVAFNFNARLDPLDETQHGIEASAYFHHNCRSTGYERWIGNLYVKDAPAGSSASCQPQDSDACIQDVWGSSYTCSSATRWCDSWTKDMYRCCPVSCESGIVTESDCNALSGSGTCKYPNDAQTCTDAQGGRRILNVQRLLAAEK